MLWLGRNSHASRALRQKNACSTPRAAQAVLVVRPSSIILDIQTEFLIFILSDEKQCSFLSILEFIGRITEQIIAGDCCAVRLLGLVVPGSCSHHMIGLSRERAW